MGVSGPLFAIGAVIVSLILWLIRSKQHAAVEGPGLVTYQDPISPIEQIPNVTQRLIQQAEGTYQPMGSAGTSASRPGVI